MKAPETGVRASDKREFPMHWFPQAMIFLIPVVGAAALFTFLAVATWAEQRRKEREAYYRYEFRKNLVAAGKMDATDVRALVEYENESDMYRRRAGSLVASFVLTGVGIGLLLGLRWVDENVAMIGWIPLMIGVALMVYSAIVAPRIAPAPKQRPDHLSPPDES
jgi:hypothetical protein